VSHFLEVAGTALGIITQGVQEKLMGRNWLHFDLYTNDRDGEVKRMLKIGATHHLQTYDPDDDFIVLEDPDGNHLYVVDQTGINV